MDAEHGKALPLRNYIFSTIGQYSCQHIDSDTCIGVGAQPPARNSTPAPRPNQRFDCYTYPTFQDFMVTFGSIVRSSPAMLPELNPLSLKLSPHLQEQVQAYQERYGLETPEAAIATILIQFFSPSNQAIPPQKQAKSVEKYASLEQVKHLEKKVSDLTQTVERLSLTLSQVLLNVPVERSTALALQFSDVEDDVEDEPDEILYDFLPGLDE
jgi:hypothetical protein